MTQDPQAIQEKNLKYITSLQNKNKSATKIEWQTEKIYFQPVTQSALFPSIQKKNLQKVSTDRSQERRHKCCKLMKTYSVLHTIRKIQITTIPIPVFQLSGKILIKSVIKPLGNFVWYIVVQKMCKVIQHLRQFDKSIETAKSHSLD